MPAIDVFWLNHSMTFLPIRGRTNQAQAVLTDPGLRGAMFAVGYSAEHAAAVTRRSLSTPSRDHAAEKRRAFLMGVKEAMRERGQAGIARLTGDETYAEATHPTRGDADSGSRNI